MTHFSILPILPSLLPETTRSGKPFDTHLTKTMANLRRLLLPIRLSLLNSSPSDLCRSHSTSTVIGTYEQFKMWMKGLEPVFQIHARSFRSELVRKSGYMHYRSFSGRKLFLGSVFGASVVTGLVKVWPSPVYAGDGSYGLEEIHHTKCSDASGHEDDQFLLWEWAKKFWSPVMLVMTVMMGLVNPLSLAINVALLFFSTKPSPYSIYQFVEKWQRQSLRQDPGLYNLTKLVYPKKIEVKDYNFLCLARVEVRGQKLYLIGILGGWWVLYST